MYKAKRFISILAAAVAAVLVLSSCASDEGVSPDSPASESGTAAQDSSQEAAGSTASGDPSRDESSSNSSSDSSYSSSSSSSSASSAAALGASNLLAEDTNDSWNAGSGTTVTMNGSSVSAKGSGVSISGSTVTINAAGTYILSGKLNNGQVIVSADKSATVRLILNGVTLNCNSSSPIYAVKAGKVIITLAAGTTNTITDGSSYVYADSAASEPDAAIFVQNALTVNGSGTLNVTGNHRNGIISKDSLVITSGTINISAVNDALRGRDSVTVTGGALSLSAGGDGIKANNTDTSLGWVSLSGGVYKITSGNDCIQAESSLYISGGTYTLESGGGSGAASSPKSPGFGGSYSPASTDSYKGIKGGASVKLEGGTFTMNCADDAIHSNGDVTVNKGSFTISTGDDGIHADKATLITGGTIKIAKSFEGIEGLTVKITGGDISVTSSDDGINAAGGSDSGTGMFGGDRFGGSSSSSITISGGSLYVNAEGDGLDSNNSITISGGTVTVDGPVSGGNGALDADGTILVNGGTLKASGSSGMAESPAASSSQPSIQVYYSTTYSAGTVIELKDSSGNSVIKHTPAKSYQNVVLSSSAMKTGSVYTLYSNGTKLCDITVSSTAVKVDDSGKATSGGSMGGGGFGGGRR